MVVFLDFDTEVFYDLLRVGNGTQSVTTEISGRWYPTRLSLHSPLIWIDFTSDFTYSSYRGFNLSLENVKKGESRTILNYATAVFHYVKGNPSIVSESFNVSCVKLPI